MDLTEMDPPNGFVRLSKAVEKFASSNPGLSREQAEKAIAEACECGQLAAAYRSITGADDLDPKVWQSIGWRNYFATGTIDLDLPLLDEKLRPNKQGFTARCTREIFIRQDSLVQFMASLAPAPVDRSETSESRPSRGPKAGVSARVTDEIIAI